MSVCHTVETLPGPAASVQVEPWCLHQGGGWPDFLSGSGQCCSQFSAPLITVFCPIHVLTSFLAQVSVTCPIIVLTSILAQVSAVQSVLPHWSQCFAPLMTWPQFWLRPVLSSFLPHWSRCFAPLMSWPPFWLRSVLSSFLPHWSQCFAPLMSWPFWLRSVLSTVFCPIDHNVLPRWWSDRIFGSGQFWPQYFAPLFWSIGGIPEVACLCLTLTLTSEAK